MPSFIDLKGKCFGRLNVLERSANRYKQTMWKCQCECGKTIEVQGKHLRDGHTKSCGCLCTEINSIRMKGNKQYFLHGFTNHPLRAIWKAMKDRCYNPNNKFYKNYGARGISVCEQWKCSMVDFVTWALENGWVKGLSIDRKDVNENYHPNNCQWITVSENSKKKKSKSL